MPRAQEQKLPHPFWNCLACLRVPSSKAFRLALLAFLLFLCSEPQSRSGKNSSLREQIRHVEQQVRSLEEESRLHEMREQNTLQQMGGLSSQLEGLDIAIEEARARLMLSELEMTENNEVLVDVSLREKRLAREVLNLSRVLSGRIRGIYRQGRWPGLRLFLGSEKPSAFLRHLHAFRLLAERDRDRIQLLESRQTALEQAREQRRLLAIDLRKNHGEAQKQAQLLEGQKQEKNRLLQELENHREGFLQQKKELEITAEQLNETLADLKENLGQQEDFAEFKGQLLWPVEGRVLSSFGRQRHHRYDTVIVRNGIQIEAQVGEPVRAVFEGRVRFSGRFQGFGKLIILEHPGRYFTLYGQLGTLKVAQDAKVQQGETLGTIGETGMTMRHSLYFELRRGLEPQNPKRWLAPLKKGQRSSRP